jgi:hypothetical protein
MFRNILVAIENDPTDQAAIATDDVGRRHLPLALGANGWRRNNHAQ